MAVAVVAILLFTGHNDATQDGGGDESPVPTATDHFTFQLQSAQVLLTSPDTNPDRAAKVAKPATAQVEKLIHHLYVQGYLTPDEWTDGAYPDTFEGFSEGAKAEAMQQLDVMTAGTAASDTIDSVRTDEAHLKQKVLIDPNGLPYSVVAVVSFTATADMKDGTTATLVSQGQYILEKTGSGWQVASFSVTRDDTVGAPSGSASASPTAVAS